MIKEGKNICKSQTIISGQITIQIRSLKEPEVDFTSQELEVIDDVIEKLGSMNATQINEYSHDDLPWMAAEGMD